MAGFVLFALLGYYVILILTYLFLYVLSVLDLSLFDLSRTELLILTYCVLQEFVLTKKAKEGDVGILHKSINA